MLYHTYEMIFGSCCMDIIWTFYCEVNIAYTSISGGRKISTQKISYSLRNLIHLNIAIQPEVIRKAVFLLGQNYKKRQPAVDPKSLPEALTLSESLANCLVNFFQNNQIRIIEAHPKRCTGCTPSKP